jgi:polysaccharide export outer membrane protein
MKVLKATLLLAAAFPLAAPPSSAQQTQQPTKPAAATVATAQPQPPAQADLPSVPTINVREQSLYTDRGIYLLGPNDVLELRVFGEPQFDGEFTVEEEGVVLFPFIDEPVVAKCRDVNGIRKDVAKALGKFLKQPRVYLRVKDQKSRKPATVYGAVRTPMNYEMRRPARLLELLSNSGGVTEQHNGLIQIWHTEPPLCDEVPAPAVAKNEAGEDELGRPFKIYRVSDLKLGKAEANPYIRHGDLVQVLEASPIYIVGNVVQPTGLYLKEGMTLTRALATVGGVREANESKVKIYRLNLSTMKQEQIIVDFKAIKQNKSPDVVLQAYDIIEVPKKGFDAKSVMDLVLGVARNAGQSVGAGVGTRIVY